jgi:hypothetical protein
MRDLELEWKGRTYAIPADRAFALAKRIEPIVSIAEIDALAKRPQFTTFAEAYAEMLAFAGVKVSADEVWRDSMAQMKAGTQAAQLVTVRALSALVEILFDGAPAPAKGGAGNGEAKAEASSESATSSPSEG